MIDAGELVNDAGLVSAVVSSKPDAGIVAKPLPLVVDHSKKVVADSLPPCPPDQVRPAVMVNVSVSAKLRSVVGASSDTEARRVAIIQN